MIGFLSRFYKRAALSLQLTAGQYAIKLSVLKLGLKVDLETNTFRIALLIIHAFLFQVFNATDNLEATTATHSFLDLNENFTELKGAIKDCFGMFLRKYFATYFTFNRSVGMTSA